jgi:hypothetical protein
MKKIEPESLLSPSFLFSLMEQWIVVQIEKTNSEDENNFHLYQQQASCKIGQINFRPGCNIPDIYFEIPPAVYSENGNITPYMLTVREVNGLSSLYLYAELEGEPDESDAVNYLIDCSVFLL